MFERYLKELMSKDISRQKVSLLIGSRRVGKTELLLSILEQNKEKTLWLEGEDSTTQLLLADRSIANYKRLLENISLLIIDEAQYIPDITLKAKLMIDHIFGLPGDTFTKLVRSYNFYETLKPDVVNVYELLYLPKAEINKHGKSKALYQKQGGEDYKKYAKIFAAIPLICH